MTGGWAFMVLAWLVVAMSLAIVTPSRGPHRETLRTWATVAAALGLATGCAHFVASDVELQTMFERRMVDDPIARLLGLVALALGAAAFLRVGTSDRARAATALAVIAALVAVGSRDLLVSWAGLEIAAFAARQADPTRCERDRVDWAITLFGALGISLTIFATASTQLDAVASAVTSAFTQWGAAQPYVDIVELAARGDGVPSGLLQQARAKAITGLTPVALLLAGLASLLVTAIARAGAWPITATAPGATSDAGFSARALVQLAAWALLLRVFVSELATARLVAAPYGWTQALPAVAVLAALGAVFVPLQPGGTGGVLEAARRARAALLLLLAAGAATMLGSGRLQARIESGTWATAVAEWTVACFVVLLGIGLLAELALVLAGETPLESGAHDGSTDRDDIDRATPVTDVAAVGIETRGMDPSIVGLAHREPGRAFRVAVASLAIAGVAPTMGGLAWWMTGLALAEHSALLWIWLLVLLGQLAVLRHVYVALAALTAPTLPIMGTRAPASRARDLPGMHPSRAGIGTTSPLLAGSRALQAALTVLLLLPLLAPSETLRRVQLAGTAFHVNATRDAGRSARLRRLAEVEAARDGRMLAAPYRGRSEKDERVEDDAGPKATGNLGESAGRRASGAGGEERNTPVTSDENPSALGFEDDAQGMSIEKLPAG